MALLALQLFGGFNLSPRDGDPVGLTERAQALLACLALVSSPVPRKHLAELLSEAGNEQEQRTTLRQTLYLVRKATTQDVIVANMKGELRLNTERVEADVELFRRAIASGDRCSLDFAVELYRGPFLDRLKSPTA